MSKRHQYVTSNKRTRTGQHRKSRHKAKAVLNGGIPLNVGNCGGATGTPGQVPYGIGKKSRKAVSLVLEAMNTTATIGERLDIPIDGVTGRGPMETKS